MAVEPASLPLIKTLTILVSELPDQKGSTTPGTWGLSSRKDKDGKGESLRGKKEEDYTIEF